MPLFGAPGERIAYAVHSGPPGAPPILLIHGFTASSASFIANVEGLRERFTVITTDLLGHGSSDAPDDPSLYGPDAAIGRLLGLLDDLGYYQVTVAGHSLGGALALRLALAVPERVAGLVIINSSTAALTPELVEAARPRYAMLAARAREEGLDFLEDSSLNPANSRWLPDDARAALLADFRRMTPDGFAATTEALTAVINAWDLVPSLTVPTLVVIGDRDEGFLRVAPGFLERLPAGLASWVTLEGAGHAANLSSPEEFNAAVIAFAENAGILVPPAPEASQRRGAVNTSLAMLGGALVVAGFAMLGAAFFLRNGNETIPAAPVPPAAQTPTVVSGVAGARTAGPATVVTPVQSSPTSPAAVLAATSTVAPTTAPAPTQPAIQATSTVAAVASTPEPASTAQPTAQPSPAPSTPTPGVFVSISGPTAVAFGEQAFFQATATGDPLRWQWSGCSQGLAESSCSYRFAEYSCRSITATAFFRNGTTLSATRVVAVGGLTCP